MGIYSKATTAVESSKGFSIERSKITDNYRTVTSELVLV